MVKIKKMTNQLIERKYLTYVLDEQRVASDPLHGFEQEAGERHSFAAVVGGDLLLGGREKRREAEERGEKEGRRG